MNQADKEKALDMIRKLNGDHPYNGGGNICRGDGYFAQSIVKEFGMSVSELSKLVGYKSDSQIAREKASRLKTLEAENEGLRAELAAIKAKGRVVDVIAV